MVQITTIGEMIDQEHQLALNGQRFGPIVGTVDRCLMHYENFIISVDREHFVAAALMMALKNSIVLSFFSILRNHIAQSEWNNRRAIEFCALTSYFLAHPDEDVSAVKPRSTYKWLESVLPVESANLKEIKSIINDTSVHSSVYSTHHTFDWESDSVEEFAGAFFDKENTFQSKLYLTSLAQITMVIARTIRRVAKDNGGFIIGEDAEQHELTLFREIESYRKALAADPDFSL